MAPALPTAIFPFFWKHCWDLDLQGNWHKTITRNPKSQVEMQRQRRIQSYNFTIFQGIFQSPPSDVGEIIHLWIKYSGSSRATSVQQPPALNGAGAYGDISFCKPINKLIFSLSPSQPSHTLTSPSQVLATSAPSPRSRVWLSQEWI